MGWCRPGLEERVGLQLFCLTFSSTWSALCEQKAAQGLPGATMPFRLPSPPAHRPDLGQCGRALQRAARGAGRGGGGLPRQGTQGAGGCGFGVVLAGWLHICGHVRSSVFGLHRNCTSHPVSFAAAQEAGKFKDEIVPVETTQVIEKDGE